MSVQNGHLHDLSIRQHAEGNLRLREFMRSGGPDKLDEAIEAFERAVDLVDLAGDPELDLPAFLGDLGMALFNRFVLTGSIADLDEAGKYCERGVEDTIRITPRSSALPARYRKWANILWYSDLGEAIRVGRLALDCSPRRSTSRRTSLILLAMYLVDRYERSRDPTDLHEACELAEEVIPLVPPGMAIRGSSLLLQGRVLLHKYDLYGELAALDESIRLAQRVAEGDRAYPLIRLSAMSLSADGLQRRSDRTGLESDLLQGIIAFKRCCVEGALAHPDAVLDAAHHWSAWALRRQSWDEVIEACRSGLGAFEGVFRHQLARPHKETWLRRGAGLTTLAAFALAQRRNPGDLVEATRLVERGRAVLFLEALQQNRPAHEDRPEAERYKRALNRVRALEMRGLQSGLYGRAELEFAIAELTAAEEAMREMDGDNRRFSAGER